MSKLEVKINASGRPDIMVGPKIMFRCMGNGQLPLARKMACAEEMFKVVVEAQQVIAHALHLLKDDPSFATSISLKRVEELARIVIAKAKGE